MKNIFKDKVAIVTGGASGIGRGLCEELGRRGADVIVADLNQAGAEEVASGISKAGGRATAVKLDVSVADDVRKLLEDTAKERGRLDYMFNNAGITIQAEALDVTEEHWRKIIDINFNGVLMGTTTAYSIMAKQGFGHIINTSSIAGLIGMASTTLYSTTKHAVVGLSTSLRSEGEALGVKVSVTCPGWVETGIFEAATVVNVDKKKLFSQIPFKKITIEEAAKEILKGDQKKKEIIVFPFSARAMWRTWRIYPGFFTLINKAAMHRFRELAEEKKNSST